MTEVLRVLPLGGIGEIGKNMTVFEYGDEIVVIDCGLMFPEEEMFGVDFVVPDITYLKERQFLTQIEPIFQLSFGHNVMQQMFINLLANNRT